MDSELAHRTLKRLFVNGPLTGLPTHPADQELLVELAATRFEPGKAYRENEVNEVLEPWLASFCEPSGIDHVTVRRMLVDSRRLVRTTSGSLYEVNAAKAREVEALRGIDPAAILAEVQDERAQRKQAHEGRKT
jgi:hypothetical protein